MADEELEFEWDEAKARINLEKHKVSFLTAATIFWSASMTGRNTVRCDGLPWGAWMTKCFASSTPGAATI